MKLDALASTSDVVAGTRKRLEKVRQLRECLLALDPDERETGVAWLAGVLPGGRLGLGPATIHALREVAPAANPTLTIAVARDALDRLRTLGGKGSAARRQEVLTALFVRATAREQTFLSRLLLGELRQGALEGVMADAIAATATGGIAPPSMMARRTSAGGNSAAAAIASAITLSSAP